MNCEEFTVKSEPVILTMPSHSDLPKFSDPPVVETVLGVQFEPLQQLTSAHLGAYWSELKDEWPTVRDAPPLDNQFELFSEEETRWTENVLQLQISQELSVRYLLETKDRDSMLQIQRNRFHYNWLGGHQGQDYPSYNYVRPNFNNEYERFKKFVDSNSLGAISPNQWEVTYVNHIPKHPALWQEPKDWATLFPSISTVRSELEGLRLEGVQAEWHYEIEPQRGRLHAQLFSGRKGSDGGKEDLLVLKLTARGPIDGEKGLELDTGLDLGHETIVQSFNSLISDSARNHWGGSDANA